ncbi:hypothetical protein [Paraburkholderia sp. JHI869]|uniref:hypothetical protein n=1 Tax=Paraburkholderia sp. JHI869 TaxID=3112959 RepID=UPI00317D9BDC
MSAFNASSSLEEELLEDAAPPPPAPALEDAEVLCVEVDEVPLLDTLPFEFDDAAPEEAPLPAPLVEVCAPAPEFEAVPPLVALS